MSQNGCCGGETQPAKYSISLSPGCDKGEAWLWMNEAPPDGSEPCNYRLACDGEGGFHVRTGKCGGWKKIGAGTVTGGGTGNGDDHTHDHTHEQLSITLEGGETYTAVDNAVTLPAYPTVDGTDPPVVPAIKVNGVEVPPVNNCIELTIPTDPGTGATGITSISVNGVDVPVDDNGNVDITAVLTQADLCSLPVSDLTSPCCNDYVAMCRAVIGADGQPTGESESVLAPVGHLNGAFAANDYDDGLANTCNGQHFYFTDGNGAMRLWLNVGVPTGGTVADAIEIAVV